MHVKKTITLKRQTEKNTYNSTTVSILNIKDLFKINQESTKIPIYKWVRVLNVLTEHMKSS